MRTTIAVLAACAALSGAISVTAVETLVPRPADAAHVQAVRDDTVVRKIKKVASQLRDLNQRIGDTRSFDSTNYMLRRICEQTGPNGDIGTCVK